MRGGGKNLQFSANTAIHALYMALGVIAVESKWNIVVSLDFVRTRPSHMHCCRAFCFVLAGLFLLLPGGWGVFILW